MASFLLNICARHQVVDKKASRQRMKCPPLVLLLWITTASVRCDQKEMIGVRGSVNGIELSCLPPLRLVPQLDNGYLEYKDEKSGEYKCEDPDSKESQKIYVKFRSCDNCVELHVLSLTGLMVANLVATALIGAAVYLTVSHSRTHLMSSNRKSSDRQHLVPNEVRNRHTNDHYQPLNHKGGQRDMYDVLTNRR